MKVRYVKGAYKHDITDVLYPTLEQKMAGGVCFRDFTNGKIYDVISIEAGGWYRLMGDYDQDYLYPPEAFEIVEALPEPPILTEEDYREGRDDKYMVVKNEIDEANLVFPKGMTIEDWYAGRCVGYDKGYYDPDKDDDEYSGFVESRKVGKRELAFA